MEKEEIEKWKKVGLLGKKILAYGKKIIKPEIPLLEIAEKIEERIEKEKAKSAFPVNLGINEIAAHFSPLENNEEKAHGLIKIDIGINIDGFLSDTACTLDLTPEQKFSELIKTNEEAINAGLKKIKYGIEIREIGKEIHEKITSKGFSPIINLTGHEIKKWNLHAGLTIPNYDNNNMRRIEEGIYALEPFVTNGVGLVQDGKPSGIYMLIEKKPVRDVYTRKILDFIEKNYRKLPFSRRWIFKKFGPRSLFSLKLLEQSGSLRQFKQLVEKSRMPVSQTEHTVLVTEKRTEILTKEE